MKRDLLDILRCPLDHAELSLDVTEEDETEVLEGTLTCQRCAEAYPVRGGIPRMLPPELRKELEARLG